MSHGIPPRNILHEYVTNRLERGGNTPLHVHVASYSAGREEKRKSVVIKVFME
jgi:hypothetical protein